MTYSPEDIQVTLVDSNGKSYTIDGFEFEQSWYNLLEVKGDGTHVVRCLDNSFNSYLVSFTEAGYNKHIKDLKPSVKSPFKFTAKEK